jgi:hypothetical protein
MLHGEATSATSEHNVGSEAFEGLEVLMYSKSALLADLLHAVLAKHGPKVIINE